MARIYGLNGALRGRQGNNVFSVQNGTQVVKAYQPVVANPRSFNQRLQRAKFALAGRISAVVPSGAIVGLPKSNARDRRAMFVSLVTNSAVANSEITESGAVIRASVNYLRIFFSRGALSTYAPHTGFTAAYQGTTGSFRVHVTLNGFGTDTVQADAPAGYGELIVVCVFDPAGYRMDACKYAIRGQSNMEFDFATPQRSGCHVALYVVPFAPISDTARYRAISALGGGSTELTLDMASSDYLSGMNFGSSVCRFSQDVAATSSMVNPSPDDDR